jgi:hypothetical protein
MVVPGGGRNGANCVSSALTRSPALADTQHLLTTCNALNRCCPGPAAAAASFSVTLPTTSGVTRCVVRLLRLGEYLQQQQDGQDIIMASVVLGVLVLLSRLGGVASAGAEGSSEAPSIQFNITFLQPLLHLGEWRPCHACLAQLL